MSLWDRVRRNHALEHGTITLLLQRAPLHRVVAGNAMPGGFFVYGDVPTETLSACATDAMERMRQGERDLAVSPFCGTNIVVAAALATVGTLAALRFSGRGPSGWARALSNAIWALVLARPLGGAIQRRYTTLAEMEGMAIKGVSRWQLGPVVAHWVSTSQEG